MQEERKPARRSEWVAWSLVGLLAVLLLLVLAGFGSGLFRLHLFRVGL